MHTFKNGEETSRQMSAVVTNTNTPVRKMNVNVNQVQIKGLADSLTSAPKVIRIKKVNSGLEQL